MAFFKWGIGRSKNEGITADTKHSEIPAIPSRMLFLERAWWAVWYCRYTRYNRLPQRTVYSAGGKGRQKPADPPTGSNYRTD